MKALVYGPGQRGWVSVLGSRIVDPTVIAVLCGTGHTYVRPEPAMVRAAI